MHTSASLPLLAVSEGMAFYVGRNIQTRLHKHHAVEIILSLKSPFFIHSHGSESTKSECCIVAPDLTHRFVGEDDEYLFLFFDPELVISKQVMLRFHLQRPGIAHYSGEEIIHARKELSACLQQEAPSLNIVWEIAHHLIRQLAGYNQPISEMDNRITEAIRLIMLSLHSEVRLNNIASQVFISPSRFAHLFKQEAGIPFRRYVLWCRMQAFMKAVLQKESLTGAAYKGGFSDMAHLSRTFTEMFGVSPSSVLKK